jgi:hypothetical protein
VGRRKEWGHRPAGARLQSECNIANLSLSCCGKAPHPLPWGLLSFQLPRALYRPRIIPGVMTIKTLADVSKLISHIPKDRRELSTWRHGLR